MAGAPTAAMPDPDHRHTASGQDGSFTDACDPAGNLLEYVCETVTQCSGDLPNPPCTTMQTGKVIPMSFDCDGHCVDGTCDSTCPMIGDTMQWDQVGMDTAVLENLDQGRTYDCMLLFDAAGDGFDCNTTPQPGDQTVVYSLGLSGQWCTGGAWGNIGVGDPAEQCAYSCRYSN